MTIGEMLSQSAGLTLLGMGIVFTFLIIMIICITLVGKLIGRVDKDADVAGVALGAGTSPVVSNNDAATVAAISAAVNEYRKTN